MPDPISVNGMFCRIAQRYDLANRVLSGGVDIWWRHKLVSAVKRAPASAILDLATGSGDVAFALSSRIPEARIVGVDFCQPMLDEAEKKRAQPHCRNSANVSFRQGDGLALPFADDSFDAATISFGLRNMADRHRCLTELHRVLKKNGRLFVLEFSQPQAWLKPLYFFYLRKILPSLAKIVTGDRAAYVYLNETIEKFPAASALSDELRAAGFTRVRAHRLSFGMVALHEAGK
jgi:demethylmenaquinone methyltransferase / 2-methoxy-6-polyprenyl-1,4-benzoquinol methylase